MLGNRLLLHFTICMKKYIRIAKQQKTNRQQQQMKEKRENKKKKQLFIDSIASLDSFISHFKVFNNPKMHKQLLIRVARV